GGGGGGGRGRRRGTGLGRHVTRPTAAGSVWASALATRRHGFAACFCESLNLSSPLYSDAIDSSGASIGAQPPAAIGVDGDLQATTMQAFGSVYVTGPGGGTVSDRI